MIEIERLSKRFGRQPVLRDLDLEIGAGRVTAVVGPNASGKTTLIKCILGLIKPDGGSIRLGGRPADAAGAYRRRIGYMPQVARFPDNLTAREVLALLHDLRGRPSDIDDALLDGFALGAELDKPLRTLSGGTRQKVSAAIAFRFRPEVFFLDEPTAGLDPISSSLLQDHILAVRARGGTVVLTSHIMSEIDALADHIVFLMDGRVWLEGPVRAIKEQAGEDRLERAVAHLLRGVAA